MWQPQSVYRQLENTQKLTMLTMCMTNPKIWDGISWQLISWKYKSKQLDSSPDNAHSRYGNADLWSGVSRQLEVSGEWTWNDKCKLLGEWLTMTAIDLTIPIFEIMSRQLSTKNTRERKKNWTTALAVPICEKEYLDNWAVESEHWVTSANNCLKDSFNHTCNSIDNSRLLK